MKLFAVRTDIVQIGQDITEFVLKSLKAQDLILEEGDILALTSKILAYSEGRLVKLSDVSPSEKAKKLARTFSLKPEFAELILREADEIYGGVEKAVLTLKNGVLTANSGVDNKNAPQNYVVLWPRNAGEQAKRVRDEILDTTGKHIALIIVDSGLVPLRLGTKGLALTVVGFKPVMDLREEEDIFGKPITITQHSVADDLASAAHLLMGEGSRKAPIVLIRDAPIVYDEEIHESPDMMISPEKCIIINALGPSKHLSSFLSGKKRKRDSH